MAMTDTAEAVQRAASAVGYGGSGTAVLSGAAMEVQKYLGMTPGEWQIVGIVGGLLFGAAGFAFNAWLGWRRDQREESNRWRK